MSIEVRGIETAIDELRRLGKLADPNVAVPALTAGGRIFAQEWSARVRKKSRATASAIGVRRTKVAGRPAVKVTAGARHHVARFLEHGYLRRSKRTFKLTHIPAYPSATPAYHAKLSEALQVVEDALFAIARPLGGSR